MEGFIWVGLRDVGMLSWLMFGSFVFGLWVVRVKSSISAGAVGITIDAWSAIMDQVVSDVG